MMVFHGTKLSLGLIIVNLLPFLHTFYPQTSTNVVQMTWNFQGKWFLSIYMSYVKIIIIEWFLETRHSSKCIFFVTFWYSLLANVCKLGLNVWKISETLLLYKFYIKCKNDENSTFFCTRCTRFFYIKKFFYKKMSLKNFKTLRKF